MDDVLLIIALVVMFVFGYFLMTRLDKFFIKNNRNEKNNDDTPLENASASCVMLTEKLSDEEIAEELKRFRKSHRNTRIMLYEEEEADS